MARRRANIDPMAFVNQQEGDGGGLKDLATLMGLLGLGEGQKEEERQSKAQQALQAYYEGQIAQQQAGGGRAQEELDIRRSEATAAAAERAAAEAARQETKRYQEEATLRDIKARESEEGYKNFAQIMASPDFTPAEKRRIASKRSSEATAVEAEMKKERVGEFTKGLKDVYKKGPKEIAAYLKNQEAIPGMKEVMQDPGIPWAELNAGMPAPQPGFVSRMLGKILGSGAGTPSTVTPVGVGGPVQANTYPAGNYSMPPQPQPTVVPPTPQPAEFKYEEGYPSAKPDYMYGIKTPVPADVINRVETDPRYQSAEAELLKGAMDWWEGKGFTTPSFVSPGTPSFVSAPGGPSAMPPTIQQPPEPGFLENFLRKISDYTASRPERVPAERYPYPIGHGVPPTVGGPIDPRLLTP